MRVSVHFFDNSFAYIFLSLHFSSVTEHRLRFICLTFCSITETKRREVVFCSLDTHKIHAFYIFEHFPTLTSTLFIFRQK